MAHLMKRIMTAPLVLTILVGISLGVGLLGVQKRSQSAHAQVADPSRAQVILDFFADRNAGDDNAAAALFADNAFFVINSIFGDCSLHTPCYDRASILQDLQVVDTAQSNHCGTVTSIEVMGDIVTGRLEARNDPLRARGIERSVLGFMAEVQDGEMISFYLRPDLGDPQTALNAAIIAGRAQAEVPIPTPTPPCG
ncbi:MAG: hypothetical protein ACYDCQ_14110 [Dehalococcoidia bacterium]